jgi:hypothetical protein
MKFIKVVEGMEKTLLVFRGKSTVHAVFPERSYFFSMSFNASMSFML